MLRKIRISLAAFFFVGITFMFLDFTGTASHLWGWMTKIQFLPAVMAANVAVVIVLLLLTLLLGRVYCSVICPLGIMQDIISRISASRRRKHSRFRYSSGKKWLRYGFLVLFVVAMIAGAGTFAALIAPYSAYGRIATALFSPVYTCANNLLAHVSEYMGNYWFYSVEIAASGLSVVAVAVVTLVVVAVLSWRNGRTYCNTVCPVGTVLGFFSRFALFRPLISESKCIKCGICSRKCKSSCIDFKSSKIDYSRCVACMNCLESCRSNAIKFGFAFGAKTTLPQSSAEPAAESAGSEGAIPSNNMQTPANKSGEGSPDGGRRMFLVTGATFAAASALQAQNKKVDGGLAAIEKKKIPVRDVRVLPPGAISAEHFARHCTACQLCVTQCPNDVLKPAQGFEHFMQPEMNFEQGSCKPDCVRCSEVCPAGAIEPITLADKSATQIGVATWVGENCVVNTKNVSCGLCARRCPAGAITMVSVKDDMGNDTGRAFPAVNFERCIGCGSCEYHCPARPFPAIYVNGIEMHRHV